mmetsp:Transcript_115994/g.361356  ORF Transcript_115994/g.361356 Transcript_115994/m.361356 type:complete len:297 (-) Transcript_115994:1425-2315(-)
MAQDPPAAHKAVEDGEPRRVLLADGGPALTERLGDAAAGDDRLEVREQRGPGQDHLAAHQPSQSVAHGVEVPAEGCGGNHVLLEAAPRQADNLDVGAHVIDRPEELLYAIKRDGLHSALCQRGCELLRRRVVDHLLVALLVLPGEVPEPVVRGPRPHASVLRALPVVVMVLAPPIVAQLLAVVGPVQAELPQRPGHGPSAALRKARHQDLDTRHVPLRHRPVALVVEARDGAPHVVGLYVSANMDRKEDLDKPLGIEQSEKPPRQHAEGLCHEADRTKELGQQPRGDDLPVHEPEE